ncbi:MAG: hypothetical protein C5B54_10205 [Acidobacteria bacterium]|nr:MAG: hypothetical protein C5B54_10205 [Acidobacteriota bacterium]
MIQTIKEIIANLRQIPQILKLLGELRDEMIKYRELITGVQKDVNKYAGTLNDIIKKIDALRLFK